MVLGLQTKTVFLPLSFFQGKRIRPWPWKLGSGFHQRMLVSEQLRRELRIRSVVVSLPVLVLLVLKKKMQLTKMLSTLPLKLALLISLIYKAQS
jgi:hypothetical protein